MDRRTEIEHGQNTPEGGMVRMINPAFILAALGWKKNLSIF